MYQPKMKLTKEETDILQGKEGETKAKLMETLVRYGDIFDAASLVPVTHQEGHLVTSFGLSLLKPVYKVMEEINAAGLKAEGGFTMDPRPVDTKNVPYSILDRFINSKILYGAQKKYEEELKKAGLISEDAFTCACYFKEVGNVPKEGDILSWAESSAVNYANSVLGARCNRNSGMIDLMGSILGKVPLFGLLTDEGRKATWKITIKTTRKPEAQILGSAIGLKVMEDVPYIVGLDRWLKGEEEQEIKDYLKDFGAATASNGAVGLYHVENLTPEAIRYGEKLLKPGYKEYVIDDEELEKVYSSYPVLWKKKEKMGQLAFIGCPHLSLLQLQEWTKILVDGLKQGGRKKLRIKTVLCTAPAVREKFSKTEQYQELIQTGARLTSICPLMYTSNPLTHHKRLLTCSNKLRTYSMARFYRTEDLIELLTGKGGK